MKHSRITAKRIFFRFYFATLVIPKMILYIGYIPLKPIEIVYWIVTGESLEYAYDSVLERFNRYRDRTVWPMTLGLKPME